MTQRHRLVAGFVVAGFAAAALGLPAEAMAAPVTHHRGHQRNGHVITRAREQRTRPVPRGLSVSKILRPIGRSLRHAWPTAQPLLEIAYALAVLIGLVRWRARRRRRYVRMWLLPFRGDENDGEAVRRLFEAWHQQLIERWWRRLVYGQPSMALELAVAPDSGGDLTAAMSLVCPEEFATSMEGSLLACYHDSRMLRRGGGLPPVRRIVGLKKRSAFVYALRDGGDQETGSLVDAILNTMAHLGSPSVVQYALVPTPAAFDRYSRARFRRIERRQARRRFAGRSEVLGAELKGGLAVQHRPLFFADIRVAAMSYHDAAAIAGTIRGGSSGENRLAERNYRPWASGRLYRRWLRDAVVCPIPDWRRGVLSSSELAALWQLPSPGLKAVRISRSAVPRMPAPPEITRDAALSLAKDESGLVGILPEDKSDGLGLIGGQKTGKTSVLCRSVRADALDPSCALIALMPKPGDALKALSMVPRDRVVHYLDLEHPEFGINPLSAPGDPAMVADKVVEAFRDVNAEGDIRGSSDRYLRQAAQAAIGAARANAIDGPANLWHMYRILLPPETAFREHVVEALYPNPRYTDTATFFGRELPGDLRDAPGQTTAKLDAPRNKIIRLLVESLDKVLRHPIQLSLDDVVRKREVLIVDGKMGTFGSDNCRVMMQFILSMLYGALQRQQQLPEHERSRVTLKIDEAHLVVNESFADAMATLRSAGLEVVAAWQYGGQIQDPKLRSGMMSLLRQRCMFSMGEQIDAREMSSIAMSIYTDMIRSDYGERTRLRVTPDTIFNLPNHHAVCSWISRGARVPPFIAQTIPLQTDEEVLRHHREAQRARGCFVPDGLPDPMPDVDRQTLPDVPSVIAAGNGHTDPVGAPARQPETVARTSASASRPGGPTSKDGAPAAVTVPEPDFDPAATSFNDPNERPNVIPPVGLPNTLTELDFDDVRGLLWDQVTPRPADRRPDPTRRELEILAALWSYRFLFASQIWRRWWSGSSQRAAQQGLNRMTSAGWVRRFKFRVGERGAQQRVYCLAPDGFALAQKHSGRNGPFIAPEASWREPQITDPRRILRDLHVNGWVLAFEANYPRVVKGWRGQRDARLAPPRRKVRGEWLELQPAEVVVGTNSRLRGLQASRFEPITPDAIVEVRIPVGDKPLRLDLMIEIDRARSSAASEERLARYDAFLTGWARALDRYGTGVTPIVVFVCEDEPSANRIIRIADRALTGCVAKAGTAESDWPFPGRRALFVAVEREVHLGSLAALALPEHPEELRVALGGPKHQPCHPRRVQIVEQRLLGKRGGGDPMRR